MPDMEETVHRNTDTGDSFVMFAREEELNDLRRNKIQPRLIYRHTGDVVARH
jgi:hypothetical protein